MKYHVLCLMFACLLAACGSASNDLADDPEPAELIQTVDHEVEVDHGGHGHDHSILREFVGSGSPKLSVEVTADSARGVNVHVTSDLQVAPFAASSHHVDGQGHYHLLVDGVKVLRFYNEWIHYSDLAPGDHTVGVELAANDHSVYAWDGKKVSAEPAISLKESSAHHHHSGAFVEFVGASPTLDIEVIEDKKSGWNVYVELAGMVIDPTMGADNHVDGVGHLHLYVNGEKASRLYGTATHIESLPHGEVEVMVALYNNLHKPYVHNGDTLSASALVVNSRN